MVAWRRLRCCILCSAFLLFHVPLPLAARTNAAERVMNKSISRTDRGNPWVLAGVSKEAYEIFESFWGDFQKRRGEKRFIAPKRVVWLNGAPGSGKGTNTPHVANELAISGRAIVTSDLLDGERFKAMKEEGKLIDDGDVINAVFSELLNGSHVAGAIVDGFPRTAQQAECVKLLHDKILAQNQRSEFTLLLFDVSEQVSVERQLGRGKEAARHNDEVRKSGKGKLLPLRKTDSDRRAASQRYQTYVEQTKQAERIMEKSFPCYRIDAGGPLPTVKANITKTLGRAK